MNRNIVLLSNFDYIFLKEHRDFEGRWVAIDIDCCGGIPLRIICVYAPNDTMDRKRFISSLDFILSTPREIIMGGDWNFVEDSERDRVGGYVGNGTVGAVEFKKLREDFSLRDAFRQLLPNRRGLDCITWRRQDVHCRLDRFYISHTLRPWLESVKHVYCLVSDHFYVDMKIRESDNKKFKYGGGYWKA